MKVEIDDGGYMPIRAYPTDAGLDLYSPVTVYIPARGNAVIDTLVHIELPHGTYGKIESKSGLNVNFGIVSCGGVIDEGYTGSIAVKLYNLTDTDYIVHRGNKIAQLIVQRCLYENVEIGEINKNTERGDNGFGSTGGYEPSMFGNGDLCGEDIG